MALYTKNQPNKTLKMIINEFSENCTVDKTDVCLTYNRIIDWLNQVWDTKALFSANGKEIAISLQVLIDFLLEHCNSQDEQSTPFVLLLDKNLLLNLLSFPHGKIKGSLMLILNSLEHCSLSELLNLARFPTYLLQVNNSKDQCCYLRNKTANDKISLLEFYLIKLCYLLSSEWEYEFNGKLLNKNCVFDIFDLYSDYFFSDALNNQDEISNIFLQITSLFFLRQDIVNYTSAFPSCKLIAIYKGILRSCIQNKKMSLLKQIQSDILIFFVKCFRRTMFFQSSSFEAILNMWLQIIRFDKISDTQLIKNHVEDYFIFYIVLIFEFFNTLFSLKVEDLESLLCKRLFLQFIKDLFDVVLYTDINASNAFEEEYKMIDFLKEKNKIFLDAASHIEFKQESANFYDQLNILKMCGIQYNWSFNELKNDDKTNEILTNDAYLTERTEMQNKTVKFLDLLCKCRFESKHLKDINFLIRSVCCLYSIPKQEIYICRIKQNCCEF